MTSHVQPSEPRGTEPAPWRPFELVIFDPTKIEESPWNRGDDWHGNFVAINDLGFPCALGDGGLDLLRADIRPKFAHLDENCASFVERVLALTPGADDYDFWEQRSYRYIDEICGIAKLRDGRFVAWESALDASGTGFHPYAVGGTADIMLTTSAHAAWLSISEKSRETLRFATLASEEALVNVLHDRYLELRDMRESATKVAGINGIESTMYGTLHYIAGTSGEFGDLRFPRITELVARWDRHYDTVAP